MAPAANRRRVGGETDWVVKTAHFAPLPQLLKEIGPNHSLVVQSPNKSATDYSCVKSVLSVMRKCVWRGSITIRMADKAKIRNRVDAAATPRKI